MSACDYAIVFQQFDSPNGSGEILSKTKLRCRRAVETLNQTVSRMFSSAGDLVGGHSHVAASWRLCILNSRAKCSEKFRKKGFGH